MNKIAGVNFENETMTIDLTEVTKDPNFSVNSLLTLRDEYLLSTFNELMDAAAPQSLKIEVVNSQTNFTSITLEDAPPTMTIEEFKEYNAKGKELSKLADTIEKHLSQPFFPSEEQLEVITMKQYPNFSKDDVRNMFALQYDLIDAHGTEAIQNIDSIASLINATKKKIYLYA